MPPRHALPPESSPVKPLTRRPLQAIQTKNRIYDTAVKIINEKGFENVTIEDITTAANVAKGSFYNYFETKDALILYTFQQSDDIYEKVYTRIKGQPFLIMMEEFIRLSYIQYEKRGKGIIKAIISNYFSYREFNFYGNDRRLIKCLRKILQSGKDEGIIGQDRSEDAMILLLLSSLIGVEVLWCMNPQAPSLPDMAVTAVMGTVKGIVEK